MHQTQVRSGRPLLTTEEAASYLNQGESTLNRLRLTGGGHKFVSLGRSVRYDPDDLDEYLIARKRSNTSEPISSAA